MNFKPQTDRRILLALVTGLIALVLVTGGAQLAALGGSPYYLVAGLMVAGTAYFSFRGDWRGIWLYGAMLALSLAWALWESSLNIWGLQSRLLAPLVLGIWIAWPVLRQAGRKKLTLVASVLLLIPVVLIAFTNNDQSVAADLPVKTDSASLQATVPPGE
ncbi:MAG: hypothetical protein AB7U34_06025, partial [Novosphingobium sp.]